MAVLIQLSQDISYKLNTYTTMLNMIDTPLSINPLTICVVTLVSILMLLMIDIDFPFSKGS